jgi:hypothetical protein
MTLPDPLFSCFLRSFGDQDGVTSTRTGRGQTKGGDKGHDTYPREIGEIGDGRNNHRILKPPIAELFRPSPISQQGDAQVANGVQQLHGAVLPSDGYERLIQSCACGRARGGHQEAIIGPLNLCAWMSTSRPPLPLRSFRLFVCRITRSGSHGSGKTWNESGTRRSNPRS